MRYFTIILFISLMVFYSSCEKNTPIKTINKRDSVITIKSINPNDSLINCELFTDLTPLIAPAFIKTYGEAQLLNINYERLIFSPKGTYLAIVIPGQVWIVDIKNNRIQLAVQKIIKNKLSFNIQSIYWLTDDTLIVKGSQIFWENQRNNGSVIFHSTIDGYTYRKLSKNELNDSISHVSPTGKFEVTFPNEETIKLKNIVTNKTQLFIDRSENWWWKDAEVSWSPNDKYFFFCWDHGSGSITLYEGVTEAKFKVIKLVSGSWELGGFSVSPISQDIAYADYHSVFIYNLDNHKVRKRIITGGFPKVIAWSVQNQIAFSAINCNKPAEPWETRNDIVSQRPKRLYVIQL